MLGRENEWLMMRSCGCKRVRVKKKKGTRSILPMDVFAPDPVEPPPDFFFTCDGR